MSKVLAAKTERTGVQTLWRDDWGQHFVSIKNRSYSSTVPIPPEKVRIWLELLGGAQ